MRAVVTGGAGFVGSHMVDLLVAHDFEVLVIDNFVTGRPDNVNPHAIVANIDVTRLAPEGVFAGVDYVFHFAGLADIVPSVERPADYMRTNVMGTVNVLEAARSAGVTKFVYAASSSCYGVNARTPTDEDAPIAPAHPYALSKYQGEQTALHWHRVYGLPVCSVRIFSAFGPRIPIVSGNTGSGVHSAFSVFLAQKLHGKPFTVVGDGQQGRDWVYVTDVCRLFLAAAERGKPGDWFNCGYGEPHSVNDLVGLLGGDVVHIPWRPGEPHETWASIDWAAEQLNWMPIVSFEDGVRETLKDIDRWANAPVWDPATLEVATRTWFQALQKREATA